MRKATIMYMWYFLANSIAYALVGSLKKLLTDIDITSVRFYISFTVIAALSVVSLLADIIASAVLAPNKKISRITFAEISVLIVVISMLLDVLLLKALTSVLDTYMNSLDQLLLAGLCQIVPVRLLRDPK